MRPLPRQRPTAGFTLIELMVTVSILGILLGVALPSYQNQIARTRRAAAAGCAMELAQFMERVYASNMRYDLNGGVATTLPAVPCRNDLSASYTLGFAAAQPAARTFAIVATPIGAQAARDTQCAVLGIDQANARTVSGTGTVAQCWR